MNSFFKDIAKISGSNTLATLVSLITGIILTRTLGPEGRGVYAALMVVPAIVLRFAEMGIRRSIIFHVGKDKFEESDIVVSLIYLVTGATILGIIVSAYFYVFLENPLFTIPLIILAVSRIPLRLLRRYAGGYFMGRQLYNTSIKLRWSFQGLYLISMVIFLPILKMGVTGALIALIASNFIVSAIALYKVIHYSDKGGKFSKKAFLSLLKFGLLYSISTFFMMLNIKVDILLMGKLSTMEELGFYSLATAIATNWQVPFAVGGVIISNSANTENANIKNANISQLIRLSLLIGVLSYIVLFAFAPFLVEILYGKQFLPGVPMIRYLLPGILLLIISKILSSRLAGEGKPFVYLYVSVPALVVNIVLNFFWIPRFGGMGAVYATNISYAFMTLAGLILYARLMDISMIGIFRYSKKDFRVIADLFQISVKKFKKLF